MSFYTTYAQHIHFTPYYSIQMEQKMKKKEERKNERMTDTTNRKHEHEISHNFILIEV